MSILQKIFIFIAIFPQTNNFISAMCCSYGAIFFSFFLTHKIKWIILNYLEMMAFSPFTSCSGKVYLLKSQIVLPIFRLFTWQFCFVCKWKVSRMKSFWEFILCYVHCNISILSSSNSVFKWFVIFFSLFSFLFLVRLFFLFSYFYALSLSVLRALKPSEYIISIINFIQGKSVSFLFWSMTMVLVYLWPVCCPNYAPYIRNII